MAKMLTALSESDRSQGREGDTSVKWPDSHTVPLDLQPTIRAQVIPRLRAALERSLDVPRHPLIVGATASRDRLGSHDKSSRDMISDGMISRDVIPHDEVAALAIGLLSDNMMGAHQRIATLRARGFTLEAILLDLLAPTALHLRLLWSDDFCGFAEMALAFCGLRGLLRQYADEFREEGGARESGLRALLAAPTYKGLDGLDADLPVFGLLLTSEFFRRAGWDACIERDLTSGIFRDTVRGWFDLVEILATNDTQLDEIAAGIRSIRRDSPNPTVGVIVCGQVFVDHPEFVRLVGADSMATDPISSLVAAKAIAAASMHDQSRASERTRTVREVRALERFLLQRTSPVRSEVAPTENPAQLLSCVQANHMTRRTLRKRVS